MDKFQFQQSKLRLVDDCVPAAYRENYVDAASTLEKVKETLGHLSHDELGIVSDYLSRKQYKAMCCVSSYFQVGEEKYSFIPRFTFKDLKKLFQKVLQEGEKAELEENAEVFLTIGACREDIEDDEEGEVRLEFSFPYNKDYYSERAARDIITSIENRRKWEAQKAMEKNKAEEAKAEQKKKSNALRDLAEKLQNGAITIEQFEKESKKILK